MTKQKLRLAFLLPELTVPEWLYLLISEVNQSAVAEVSLLALPKIPLTLDLLKHDISSRRSKLYRRILTKDKEKYKLSPNAFNSRTLSDIDGFRHLELEYSIKNNRLGIHKKNAETLIGHQLDLFVNLTGHDIAESLVELTANGVWTFQLGDPDSNTRSPAGVFEFLTNSPTTALKLVSHQNNLAAVLLGQTFSSTDKFGVYRSLNNFLWKAPFLLLRELKKLHSLGTAVYYKDATEIADTSTSEKLPKINYPSDMEIIRGLVANYWRRFRKKLDRKFRFEQYILLFKFGSEATQTNAFDQFNRIVPPKDRFWADPFVIRKNETYYIFIEELIYKNGLGTIGVIEMDENGVYGKPKMVLEKDYHLSYPFLIEENDQLYMIPESSADNTIQLYRCVEFPLEWELEEVVMNNVQALDTTVHYHNEKYWMFANMKEHPGISGYDELFLFYSDKLVGGNWVPHPQNPIVSDVRSARPAGGIFTKNGKLYRPAQNCAKRYGYGMQIAEIETLTETAYKETIVQSIFPDWARDLRTTHTINHNENLTVIDALIGRRK